MLLSLPQLDLAKACEYSLLLQMIFTQRKDGQRKHFRRQHDKKVTSLALSALIVCPEEALPQQVQAGMGQVTAGCLKLLQDLKKQQVSSLSISSAFLPQTCFKKRYQVEFESFNC